jgi:hypothetical protein
LERSPDGTAAIAKRIHYLQRDRVHP